MKEFKFEIDGRAYQASVEELEDNMAQVVVNGKAFQVRMPQEEAPAARTVRPQAQSAAPAPKTAGGVFTVKSPLPGSIVKVVVAAGQAVKKGDLLLTMESMKMENNVVSEVDGTVKAVLVEAGKNVMQDDKLVEIETAAAAAPAPAAEAPKPAAAPAPKAEAPKPAAAPAPKNEAPVAGIKVTSPLPGSVIKVMVSEGQAVKKGDTLLTLESMKMENAIMADADGVVKKIAVVAGQNVMQDDLLVIIG
ncbi:MAG: biotin/lipoyl-binding protein [Bacteroidales bacterium]|nr:biotin/lipoyl-binding protein [Bacteroidales bacterium]